MSREEINDTILDAQESLVEAVRYLKKVRKWAADLDLNDMELGIDTEICLIEKIEDSLGDIRTGKY